LVTIWNKFYITDSSPTPACPAFVPQSWATCRQAPEERGIMELFPAAELKTIQEVIALTIFSIS